MQTVELFAGIGGFRLAAERLGWRTRWANDLCPRACAVYRDRFDDVLRDGDLREQVQSIPAHDLLTAGFPCQPFSSAGKKEGVRDARGSLFHVIVAVLATHRPRFFVLENVKRLLTMEKGRHFATILGALASLGYRVEWRLLNALHFGLPQNRQRVFLLGSREANPPIRLAVDDLRGHPGERGRWPRIDAHRQRFPSWGIAVGERFFGADVDTFAAATPLTTLASVLQYAVPDRFDFTDVTRGWLDTNRPVGRFVNGVEILSNQRGGARMGYTIFGIAGVAPTLTSTTSRHYERYRVGDRYRRLTNVEYARIQGFPDDHARAVPVYAQYALYGNAVPPPMATWVLQQVATHGAGNSGNPG